MPGELKATPECLPCALQQVLSAAKRVSKDAWFQGQVVKQVMADLSRIDIDRTPAEVSFDAYRAASRLFGGVDPFAAEKRNDNARMMELLPDLRRLIAESTEPVGIAARLAIAGNIIDLGILSPVDAKAEIDAALRTPLAIDDRPAFQESLRAAKTVLYILDNAGEIVLDRLLIEQMRRKEITCLVRFAPIINDVTMADAEETGLTELARVIHPESPMLGFVLSHASGEVQDLFEKADVVVSKGQANYETLAGCEREVFFFLRAKCPVVANSLGVPLGSGVLKRHNPSETAGKQLKSLG